jgi:hypothetical protein
MWLNGGDQGTRLQSSGSAAQRRHAADGSAPPLMPIVRPQMRKKSKPTGFAAASDTATKRQ